MAESKDSGDVLTAILAELRGLRAEVDVLRKASASTEKNVRDLRTQINASNATVRAKLEAVNTGISSIQAAVVDYTKPRTQVTENISSSDSRGSKRRRRDSDVILLEDDEDTDKSGGSGEEGSSQDSGTVNDEQMTQKAYMTSDEILSANKPNDPLSAFPIRVSNRINLQKNGETAYAVELRTADDAVVNGVFSERSNAESFGDEWLENEDDEEAEFEIIEVTVSTD